LRAEEERLRGANGRDVDRGTTACHDTARDFGSKPTAIGTSVPGDFTPAAIAVSPSRRTRFASKPATLGASVLSLSRLPPRRPLAQAAVGHAAGASPRGRRVPEIDRDVALVDLVDEHLLRVRKRADLLGAIGQVRRALLGTGAEIDHTDAGAELGDDHVAAATVKNVERYPSLYVP
jgi:hypothetical protein